MTPTVLGLGSTGLGLLSLAAGQRTIADACMLGAAGFALLAFATDPAPFAHVLILGLAGLACWRSTPAELRTASALASLAPGFLCALAVPHLGVLAVGQVSAAWAAWLATAGAGLGALVLGICLAGPPGACFGLIGFLAAVNSEVPNILIALGMAALALLASTLALKRHAWLGTSGYALLAVLFPIWSLQ